VSLLADALAVRMRRGRRAAALVCRITSANLLARLAYRGDFAMQIVFGILWNASTLVFAGVLLTTFRSGLGGFPSDGVLLIIGMRLISHGLYVLLFDNLYDLPTLVDEGRLDGYLVRPLPVLPQILLSRFRVNALGDLAVGVVTFALSIALVNIAWSPGRIAFLAAALTGGLLFEAALQLLVACLVLRHNGARLLGVWLDELLGTIGNYPLSILPRFVADLFTFLVPLAVVAYLPAEVLLGIAPRHGPMSVVAHASPAVGALLFAVALRCWSWCLRYHQSVGG
jgi:ABC-2 type transport system permease protein